MAEMKEANKPEGPLPNKEEIDSNSPCNIYDMEININSILGFVKGWDIRYSDIGKKQSERYKKRPTIIYSIIGNKNRGKSYILSKIADRKIPFGYSVTTKGLSISYPTFNTMTLLDSVGFESPLLENDGEEYRLKTDNQEENENFYQKSEELREKIQQLLKDERADPEDIIDLESEFFNNRNEFRKKIKDKDDQINFLTNERRMTDFFLQRFIVENANVIILVVGKLSIDDQFFLNKLTKLIRDNNKVFLQKIIVIHNLISMKEIKDVEDYIENTLNKSLTFTLIKSDDLYLKDAKGEFNKYRYYEKDKDPDSKDIIHLIMAQDGTEAGNYYNDSAIDYIRKSGGTVLNSSPFDIIERLKKYFCEVSETIIKLDDPNDKIIPDNIELRENKLILNYQKKINLETFYGGLFEGVFGDPKFTPRYDIISSDPNYLKIYLDCPGKTEIYEVKINYPCNQNEYTNVIIKGKREKEEYKTMGRKFSSGDFELKIILRGKDGDITKRKKIENLNNGFILIKIEKSKN